MEKRRIENAIKILKFAIDNNISVKSACKEFSFGNTYVKNVKLLLKDKTYKNDQMAIEFFNLYDKYRLGKLSNLTKSPSSEQKPKNDDTSKESLNIKNEDNGLGLEYNSKNRVITLDDLLKKAKVDTNLWNVKQHVINKWDVISFKSGEPVVAENYQVKAWLEKNKEAFKVKSSADVFIEMVKNYKPPVTQLDNVSINEDNLLEISLFDLHLGKLAWGGETGENYDVKIASERFIKTIKTLLKRAEAFTYERILFPIGSDFFNSDTIHNTTTMGTPQDEDLRWQKTFNSGVRLLVDGINLLKHRGVPIDVVVIPGNHDFERSFYMGAFLEAWFKDDNMVSVNNDASPRKYYRYGNLLLGLTHGNEEKQDSLSMLMATDIASKPHWSETKFHEWHLGHIHRKKTVKYVVYDKNQVLSEDMGVTVRYLSSLTGTEEWHHKKGFVGQVKAGDAFIWNNEVGLIAHLNSNFMLE